jgi:polysaccharide biosynthesis transport protein
LRVVPAGQGSQLIDLLRAIRRRWQVVALVTALVLAGALTISLTSEKQYEAAADLLFGGQSQVETLVSPDGSSGSNDPERDLNTDVQLIKLDTVAQAVLKRLRLDTSVEDLLKPVEPETSSTSDIVAVIATDPSAVQAAAIANAFAEEYVAYRRRAARQALVQASDLAKTRYQALPASQKATEEGRQLAARARELEITAALQTGGVEVVRNARVPTDAASPRPKLSAALGLFLGLIIGAAIALGLEFADRRIKDEEGVERVFDLPLVAAIPPPPRRGVDDHLQREAYGLLAANVRLSTPGDSQVLMVTSPSPADGKTSVALGLSRALARLGVRVILIESDLRRPSIARYVGLPPRPGLAALLTGASQHLAHELVWLDATSMEPVTMDDLKEGVSFAAVVAGSVPANPQRLLARKEMAEVIETARSLADVVIIDTPPIGTVNDSATLARYVDSVLVVARLNKTTKDAARRALRVLHNLSSDLVGVVATDAPVVDQYAYYGIDASLSDDRPVEGARN